MLAIIRTILVANERIAIALNRVLSWSIWVPIILVASFGGLILRQEDLVILLLTIQTSVDAAATKTLQSHVRDADVRRERVLQETVDNLAAVVVDLRVQNDLIIDMIRMSERRDVAVAKRDRVMLNALEARNDLLEFLREGVMQRGGHLTSAKARKLTGGKRHPNGRAARKG